MISLGMEHSSWMQTILNVSFVIFLKIISCLYGYMSSWKWITEMNLFQFKLCSNSFWKYLFHYVWLLWSKCALCYPLKVWFYAFIISSRGKLESAEKRKSNLILTLFGHFGVFIVLAQNGQGTNFQCWPPLRRGRKCRCRLDEYFVAVLCKEFLQSNEKYEDNICFWTFVMCINIRSWHLNKYLFFRIWEYWEYVAYKKWS
jgi:hypothetical protein